MECLPGRRPPTGRGCLTPVGGLSAHHSGKTSTSLPCGRRCGNQGCTTVGELGDGMVRDGQLQKTRIYPPRSDAIEHKFVKSLIYHKLSLPAGKSSLLDGFSCQLPLEIFLFLREFNQRLFLSVSVISFRSFRLKTRIFEENVGIPMKWMVWFI